MGLAKRADLGQTQRMRTALFALALCSAAAAHAQSVQASVPATESIAPSLVLDDALMADASRVVALEAARSAPASSPAGHTFGLGIQVGAPTAITLKYMLAPTQGIVVGVGAGFGYGARGFNAGLSIHADYLFDVAQLVNNGTVNLSAYLGPGLWLALFNHGYGFGYGYYYAGDFALFGIGARLPLGLSLGFQSFPLEIYLELDPALFIFPGVDFGIGASLGFRFYF
jgi:hypothetical protein